MRKMNIFQTNFTDLHCYQIGSSHQLETYQTHCICQILDIPYIDIVVGTSL